MSSILCPQHFKHIEGLAFCSEDLTLLCINCILHGGHKQHQFGSIQDAVTSEQDLLLQQLQVQSDKRDRVMTYLQNLQDITEYIHKAEEKQSQEIGKFFTEIHKILVHREEEIRLRLQDTLTKHRDIVRQYAQSLQEVLQRIITFQQESTDTDDQLAFLRNAQRRHQQIQQLQQQVKAPDLKLKIPEFNKEQELLALVRVLQGSKIQTKQQQQQQQQQQQTPSTKQKTRQQQQQMQTVSSSCSLFKKANPQQKSNQKQPLLDSNINNTSTSSQKAVVQINLSKSKNGVGYKLTNLKEARTNAKERSQERQAMQDEYRSITPRKMKSLVNEDDSMKYDFNTFLQSEISSLNRSDISQLCQNMSYRFLIVGGFVDDGSQVVERYDPKSEQSEQWDVLRSNRAKFGIGNLQNGNVMIMGGKLDGVRVSQCDEYNYESRRVVQSSRMTSARSGFGVVVVDDNIFVVGGNDGSGPLNVVEVYNQQQKQWSKRSVMLEKRDELGVVLGLDGNIYAIGGFGGVLNQCLQTSERYNISKNSWEYISCMSIGRRALAVVKLPDGIYAIGGFNGQQYLSSVERYDELSNTWQIISPMIGPRCTLSAVVSPDNQYIYVFGGFDNGPLDTVEKYSVLNETWHSCSSMMAKRFMHQTIIIHK